MLSPRAPLPSRVSPWSPPRFAQSDHNAVANHSHVGGPHLPVRSAPPCWAFPTSTRLVPGDSRPSQSPSSSEHHAMNGVPAALSPRVTPGLPVADTASLHSQIGLKSGSPLPWRASQQAAGGSHFPINSAASGFTYPSGTPLEPVDFSVNVTSRAVDVVLGTTPLQRRLTSPLSPRQHNSMHQASASGSPWQRVASPSPQNCQNVLHRHDLGLPWRGSSPDRDALTSHEWQPTSVSISARVGSPVALSPRVASASPCPLSERDQLNQGGSAILRGGLQGRSISPSLHNQHGKVATSPISRETSPFIQERAFSPIVQRHVTAPLPSERVTERCAPAIVDPQRGGAFASPRPIVVSPLPQYHSLSSNLHHQLGSTPLLPLPADRVTPRLHSASMDRQHNVAFASPRPAVVSPLPLGEQRCSQWRDRSTEHGSPASLEQQHGGAVPSPRPLIVPPFPQTEPGWSQQRAVEAPSCQGSLSQGQRTDPTQQYGSATAQAATATEDCALVDSTFSHGPAEQSSPSAVLVIEKLQRAEKLLSQLVTERLRHKDDASHDQTAVSSSLTGGRNKEANSPSCSAQSGIHEKITVSRQAATAPQDKHIETEAQASVCMPVSVGRQQDSQDHSCSRPVTNATDMRVETDLQASSSQHAPTTKSCVSLQPSETDSTDLPVPTEAGTWALGDEGKFFQHDPVCVPLSFCPFWNYEASDSRQAAIGDSRVMSMTEQPVVVSDSSSDMPVWEEDSEVNSLEDGTVHCVTSANGGVLL